MDRLLPIIRRARRPLLPPDDPAPAVPPAAVEPPTVVPPVVAVVEASPEPVAPPARGVRKEKKRAETPST